MTAPTRAERQSVCFVCGPENPLGLHIPYREESDGSITAQWAPPDHVQGFRGIVHGGIVSTVLDEAMSKAVALAGSQALTAELRVRLRRHVAPGQPVHIRGWVVKQTKRLIQTEAILVDCQGTEHAHAWASFLELPHA